MKRNLQLAIPVLISLLAVPALAGPDNASWNRDVERLDFYTNPPEGGDNAFFTGVVSSTSSANVTMMYMNTMSMNKFIYTMYEMRVRVGAGSGCSNSFLNARTYFMPSTGIAPPLAASTYVGKYQPSKTYPDPITAYSGGPTDHFVAASAYQYLNWNLGGNALSAPGAQTPNNACANATGNNGSLTASCVSCLNSAGYWLNPTVSNNDTSTSAGVFMGNWLNFYPPKWVLMDLAFRRLEQNGILNSLRTSVAGVNGLVGASSLQKMLPQSCTGQGRPKGQALASLDDITYTSTGHPIAEALFNVAWYLGGQPSSWVFSNTATFSGTAIADKSKSAPCNGCNGNFTLLFSDGRGDSGNPYCHPDTFGNVPPACTAKATSCFNSDVGATMGLGAEGDGDDFLDPTLIGGAGTLISGPTTRVRAAGTCDFDVADDVAAWMSTHDVSPTQTGSRVSVFVVGLGPKNSAEDVTGRMNILSAIATNGGGAYIPANDYATLEAGVFNAINSIIKNSTSFSTAAITTVQTRAQTAAFIPRFVPAPGNEWTGKLFRFGLFNEFTAGCGPAETADGGVKDALNPNGNTSCTDVYLQDQTGAFIGETPTGVFAQVDTSQPYDFDGGTGFPIKYVTNPDGGAATTIAAVPFWEAADSMAHQINQTALDGGVVPAQRTIYTVLPDGSGGYGTVPQALATTAADAFNVANVATLTPLLALNGAQSGFCSNLAIATRHTYTPDSAGEQACATDLINYILGQDVMLQDATNRQTGATTAARPKVLGDIFHSSPILVTPPVPPVLGNLGFLNQFHASLATDSSQLTPGGTAAYGQYQTGTAAAREQILVVGANDGMIHAFDAGQGTSVGNGAELWAFIPPDMLPKLQRYVLGGRHELLVDGTPMVRDIWVDGGANGSANQRNGKKEANEYHTVAIVPEREGGHFYSALDITDTRNPQFLWSWPPAGSTESLVVGETWDDHIPTPPPIGPVLVDDPNGPIVPSNATGSTHAREAWVVSIGGGFDPNYIRGRGIYVLDAWTGVEYYRFAREDSKGPSDPVNNLFPVAGTVAMLDTDADGIFDTISVGDIGGQLWTITMKSAGKASSGAGFFDNWFGGRAFIQFKGQALYHRSPFFAIASASNMNPAAAAGLSYDQIRVLIGSGDRDQIKDIGGATCGLANLRACIRKDCAVDIQAVRQRIGAAPKGAASGHSVTGEYSYASGGTSPAIDTYSVDQTTLAQSVSSTDVVDASFQTTVNCGGTSTTYSNTAYCDWGATTAGFECPDDSGRPFGTVAPGTSTVTQENARFYGINIYGDSLGSATSGSTKRPLMLSYSQAQTYDQNAYTESNLVDVTSAGASGTATSSSPGWVYTYQTADEKTANGALILPHTGGIIWSSLVPTASTVQCGGTIPPDIAHTYVANLINGGTSFGIQGSQAYNNTVRYTSHNATVAPPPFTAVLSVNSSQQYSIAGISLQPGVAPQSINGALGDLSNFRYWLEVPREVHDCRHGNSGVFTCK